MSIRSTCDAVGSLFLATSVVLSACAAGAGADPVAEAPDGSMGNGTPDAMGGSGATSGANSASGANAVSGASGASVGAGGTSGAVSGAGTSGVASASGATGASEGDAGPGASGTSGGDGGSAADAGNASPATVVLQHHTNATRDGVYVDPLMTQTYARTLKQSSTFAPAITGNVYAQPLYIRPGPPGHDEALIVATEGTATGGNHVTVLDATNAMVIWDKAYGTPVSSGLGCGNINPLGITGTPIIDPTSRTLYFDALDGSRGTPKHMVHAVSLDQAGAEVAGWPVDVDAKVNGFDSKTQNQRGALALLNGVLYIPYGGHDGDCGRYYGRVIGINVANPTSITSFATGLNFPMGTVGATKGGIWGVGGVASDGVSLFVSTGNTLGATAWSGGEAVLRLDGPGLAFSNTPANAFFPAAWAHWDAVDLDLGGANPVVFDMPNADGGVAHLVAALGKDGNLYLLNRDNLGGADGRLSTVVVAAGAAPVDAGNINGAPAVYTTRKGTYIAFHVNATTSAKVKGCANPGNVGVAKITQGSPVTAAVVWCTVETNLGSPMVTTTGNGDAIVWDANTHLFGYDGDTGARVFDGASFTMASPMQYFNTPIGANGRIVVATSGPGHLYVFKP